MPMASSVKVTRHRRRVGGKIYIVKGYVRHKRPMSRRVKKYVSVGTLEIGHDKYGNIVNNRVIMAKKKKQIKHMRIDPDEEFSQDISEWVGRHKREARERKRIPVDVEFKEDVKDWLKNKL